MCRTADFGQVWPENDTHDWPSDKVVTQRTMVKCGKNNDAPHWRTLSHCRLWPNVAQKFPLIGGLSHAVDFNQMWPKRCPSLEDFVTQRTSTKCGPKCAPHWRTLSCRGLQPNVAQNVPIIGGLSHAVDFDQMWPKICPLLEDFVMQRTLTKCGPKCAPHWRTLSHSRLHPNVVQTCALWWVTLFCYRVWPHMDRQRTHHQKRPVPSKRILFVNQCRTKTAISNYNAMWSIHWKVSMPTSLDKEMTGIVSITWQMTNDVDCTQPSPMQHCTPWERKAFL